MLEHRGLSIRLRVYPEFHVLTLAVHQNNLWRFINLFLKTDAWASPKTLTQ